MHGDLSSLLDPRERKKRLLLLDYDGTLVPFAATPDLAIPDVSLLSLLRDLSSRDDTQVHVVSGRCRHTLDSWLGHLPIGLHAEHGYWSRPRADQSWAARFADDHRPWMERALAVMAAPVAAVTGTFVERKSASLAWHYRNGDPFRSAVTRDILRERLTPLCATYRLGIIEGVYVMELRQGKANKGHVVRDVVNAEGTNAHVVAIGDDVTDEDMFAALPIRGVAISAGTGASSPRHRLDGPAHVRRFLRQLCDAPPLVTSRTAAEVRSG